MRRTCDGTDPNLSVAALADAICEELPRLEDLARRMQGPEDAQLSAGERVELVEGVLRCIALLRKPERIGVTFVPCACGRTFDDVSHSLIYPHDAIEILDFTEGAR